jgi:crotonobetainyl-CoA:carnitine CoA-transferase CaiB-like acyl-CoA transferase
VPSGEILDLGAALAQAQIAHRGTIQSVHEPGIGDLKLFNLTAKFEKTPASIDAPPPRLSAHTDEILGALGYDAGAIAAFRQKGVV